MKLIKYLDLKKINQNLLKRTKNKIFNQLNSGNYILDKNVKIFEEKFAQFNNAKYCISVNSGHDALKIALKSLNVKNKDLIMVPSMTYISTYFSILELGATPYPIDINKYGVIDINKLPKKPQKKIKGILSVNLYGNLCNYKILKSYTKKHSLFLLEDSSQSHGAYFIDNPQKKFWGDASVFSFYPSKNLGSICDGGAIITNNSKIYKRSQLYRNYGSEKKYYHITEGYNSRLNASSSIFLLEKLKVLNKENILRSKQEKIYIKKLKSIKNLFFLHRNANQKSSHHIFSVFTKQRYKLQKYLKKHNIETLIHYPVMPVKQPAIKKFKYNSKKFTVANLIEKESLSLPLGSHLSPLQQEYIINKIKKFFN